MNLRRFAYGRSGTNENTAAPPAAAAAPMQGILASRLGSSLPPAEVGGNPPYPCPGPMAGGGTPRASITPERSRQVPPQIVVPVTSGSFQLRAPPSGQPSGPSSSGQVSLAGTNVNGGPSQAPMYIPAHVQSQPQPQLMQPQQPLMQPMQPQQPIQPQQPMQPQQPLQPQQQPMQPQPQQAFFQPQLMQPQQQPMQPQPKRVQLQSQSQQPQVLLRTPSGGSSQLPVMSSEQLQFPEMRPPSPSTSWRVGTMSSLTKMHKTQTLATTRIPVDCLQRTPRSPCSPSPQASAPVGTLRGAMKSMISMHPNSDPRGRTVPGKAAPNAIAAGDVTCPAGHYLEPHTTTVPGSTCDVCSRRLDMGGVSWRCIVCNWDTCEECKSSKVKINCPEGHLMQAKATPLDNYSCDSCKEVFPKGTTMWTCRPCDYDICRDCKPVDFACSKGHILQHWGTDKEGYSCDMCSGKFPMRSLMWTCRHCDYDVCEDCKPTAINCPENHALKRWTAPAGSSCDSCSKLLPDGGLLWGCRQCNWDICIDCKRAKSCAANRQLQSWFPDVNHSEIANVLGQCAGDVDIAAAALNEGPPDLHEDPTGWFKYFMDGDGSISQEALVEAVMRTFVCDEAFIVGIRAFVEEAWASLRVPSGASMTMEVFAAPGAAADRIWKQWGNDDSSSSDEDGGFVRSVYSEDRTPVDGAPPSALPPSSRPSQGTTGDAATRPPMSEAGVHLLTPQITQPGLSVSAAQSLAGSDAELEEEDEYEMFDAKPSVDQEKKAREVLAMSLCKLPDDGVLGVYFYADLTAPFSSFTNTLRQRHDVYNQKGLGFSVLAVSADRDGSANSSSTTSLGAWAQLMPYRERRSRKRLATILGVDVIPCLVVVDKGGRVITTDGLKAVKADPEGERFPWRPSAFAMREEEQKLDRPEAGAAATASGSPQALAVFKKAAMNIVMARRTRVVDDETFAEKASKVAISEEGYRQVASFQSNYAMRRFTSRILDVKCWTVTDEAKLSSLMWDHAGTRGTKTLKALLEDLALADWVTQDEEAVNELNMFTEELQQQGTFASGKQLLELRPVQPGGAKHTAPEGSPGGPAQVGSVATSVAAAGGAAAPAGAAGVDPAVGGSSGKGAVGPVPSLAGIASQKLGPVAKGARKGKCGAPPVAGKGPPAPGTSSQAMTSPRLGSPRLGQNASSGGTAADAKVKNGRLSGGSAASKGSGAPKGPGSPKGPKGPGAPKGKGGPPMPGKGAKGCPAAPAGAKGKGKAPAAVPTREEKENWVGKKKPQVRWKRRLRGEGGIDESIFSEGVLNIDEKALEKAFVSKAAAPLKAVVHVEQPKKEKPILWEETAKDPPAKRRSDLAILMRAWQKPGELFLTRLAGMLLKEILTDPDFRDDLFMQLMDRVALVKPKEWSRLAEPDAANTYLWEPFVEGFFKRLQDVPQFREKLDIMAGHLTIERDLGLLNQLVDCVEQGLRSIRNCSALPVVLGKLLAIGNCFNAGDKVFGRADGFDAVLFLEQYLLASKPRTVDGKMHLGEYLKSKEIVEEDREPFNNLVKALKSPAGMPWTAPKEDADDIDIGDMQKESGDIGRHVAALEKNLVVAMGNWAGSTTGDGVAAAVAEDAAGAKKKRQEALLAYDVMFTGHREAVDQIDARIEGLRNSSQDVHNFLLHIPPEKKKYCVGRVLAVMASLSKMLALPAKRPPRARLHSASEEHLRRRIGSALTKMSGASSREGSEERSVAPQTTHEQGQT